MDAPSRIGGNRCLCLGAQFLSASCCCCSTWALAQEVLVSLS